MRRRFLRGAVGSGTMAAVALPGNWVRPVVDAVVLPAHAQTSPGEPLRDGDYSGSGFGLDVDDEALTGLLDWIIAPARAANGLAIGDIVICVENGEFRLSRLSIIDDDDGDDLEVDCVYLVGGDDPGQIDGASQDVLSSDGSVGTIEVNTNTPDARVRLDLLVDGVSITGVFNLPRLGSPSCKKAKKVSSCSITRKKKAMKTVRLDSTGRPQVAHGQPAPRRGLGRTSRVKRDKPVYRFTRTNHGTRRRIT